MDDFEKFLTCVILVAFAIISGLMYSDHRDHERCREEGGVILSDECYLAKSLVLLPQ